MGSSTKAAGYPGEVRVHQRPSSWVWYGRHVPSPRRVAQRVLKPRSTSISRCSIIAPVDTFIWVGSVLRHLKLCRTGLNGVRKSLGSSVPAYQ